MMALESLEDFKMVIKGLFAAWLVPILRIHNAKNIKYLVIRKPTIKIADEGISHLCKPTFTTLDSKLNEMNKLLQTWRKKLNKKLDLDLLFVPKHCLGSDSTPNGWRGMTCHSPYLYNEHTCYDLQSQRPSVRCHCLPLQAAILCWLSHAHYFTKLYSPQSQPCCTW